MATERIYSIPTAPGDYTDHYLIADKNGNSTAVKVLISDLVGELSFVGGNIATLTNGTAAAGQKNITVDSTVGFVVGGRVAYQLVGGDLEYNVIDTITPTTVLTMTTNIGTGGIGDNVYVSLISTSEYLTAQAIPHDDALTMPKTMEYANGGTYNVQAYGASPAASAATNTAAIQAAIDAVEASGVFGRVFIPAGTYAISDDTLTLFDADPATNRIVPEFIGAGPGVTILQLATPDTGIILTVEGSWRISGITFAGYEDATYSIGTGTGVFMKKCETGALIENCHFAILGYGFKTDVYTGSTAVNNFTMRDCNFAACSQAGAYFEDVQNDIKIERCHFSNGYPGNVGTAGNLGYGLRFGYSSGISVLHSNFRTHVHGLVFEGTQGPTVRDCYFETVSADSDAYINVGPVGDGVAIAGDTLVNGAANASQKVVTVDSTSGWYENAIAVYHLAGGALEYNKVASVDVPGSNQLTLVNNIGTGGIANNARIYASKEARSATIDACWNSFYDNTQSFFKARYLFNATLSNNWSTAAGDGLVDIDTTVKGLVLLNNRNDNDNTPVFKDAAQTYPPYDPPNGSTSFVVDVYNATNEASIHLPRTIYSLPNNAGETGFILMDGATQVIVADASLTNLLTGLKVGNGDQITKYLGKYDQTLDFGTIPANTTAELTVTVTGAAVGDQVIVAPKTTLEAGLVWCGYVSAPDTVTVRLGNVTTAAMAANIDPGARNWTISVIQHA